MTRQDELRKMVAEATPGPWRWSNSYETMDGRDTWSLLGDKHGYGILSCDGEPNSPQALKDLQNAALIAQAPTLATDLAAALDEVEALRAEVARLREALEPFAEAAEEADEYGFDDENQAAVDCGMCRCARAVLTGVPQ